MNRRYVPKATGPLGSPKQFGKWKGQSLRPRTQSRSRYLYATAALDGPASGMILKCRNPTSRHQPAKSDPE